jgi:hypothetical protein
MIILNGFQSILNTTANAMRNFIQNIQVKNIEEDNFLLRTGSRL